MTLAVREARPEEYEAVGRLSVDAFAEIASALPPESWASYAADLADIAHRAEVGTVLVAEDGGGLAGTVTHYPARGAQSGDDWRWWPADYAYLRALAVPPAARGRGAGRLLTQACIDRARAEGAGGIALNTSPLMVAALGLYQDMGFRQVDDAGSWEGMRMMSFVMPLAPPLGP